MSHAAAMHAVQHLHFVDDPRAQALWLLLAIIAEESEDVPVGSELACMTGMDLVLQLNWRPDDLTSAMAVLMEHNEVQLRSPRELVLNTVCAGHDDDTALPGWMGAGGAPE